MEKKTHARWVIEELADGNELITLHLDAIGNDKVAVLKEARSHLDELISQEDYPVEHKELEFPLSELEPLDIAILEKITEKRLVPAIQKTALGYVVVLSEKDVEKMHNTGFMVLMLSSKFWYTVARALSLDATNILFKENGADNG